jgi:hypothetical protein
VSDIKLPFWIASKARPDGSLVPPCDPESPMWAFTSGTRRVQFLNERPGESWMVAFVADADSLLLAVADAHYSGAEHFCFDPKPDGSGGRAITLEEVLIMINRTL